MQDFNKSLNEQGVLAMLPALQPSRPKLQTDQRPSRPPKQQSRSTVTSAPDPQSLPSSSTATHLQTAAQPSRPPSAASFFKPRSQIEAMPPLAMLPPRNLYDSAVRHPVFFTEQLRKPPFPMPDMGSQGWSPVANGYIMEKKKAGGPQTKL
ncbi:hypothetical protein CC78DRAFT_514837 [Lojkania enalia]|uniref:Uncharacterized protein n=1 Tax=Lojkania enalia TaxID=147567 RepID=A0A9P4KGS9_9PLEO|nr:hypothetical protein CC78DRAFT_514837 [Didymosphaeria enalia]